MTKSQLVLMVWQYRITTSRILICFAKVKCIKYQKADSTLNYHTRSWVLQGNIGLSIFERFNTKRLFLRSFMQGLFVSWEYLP